MRAGFKDICSESGRGQSGCIRMKGIAVLNNGCAEAVGVQIKIIGYDNAGAPVSTRDLWPASISNIPTGDYTFSLDGWLSYEPDMVKFKLKPTKVTRW